jgi:hypothetical protein
MCCDSRYTLPRSRLEIHFACAWNGQRMTWATERSLFNLFLLPSWIDREIDVQRRVVCSQMAPAGPAPPVGSVRVRRHSRPLAIAAAVCTPVESGPRACCSCMHPMSRPTRYPRLRSPAFRARCGCATGAERGGQVVGHARRGSAPVVYRLLTRTGCGAGRPHRIWRMWGWGEGRAVVSAVTTLQVARMVRSHGAGTEPAAGGTPPWRCVVGRVEGWSWVRRRSG